jgi:isochorismate pyruvate lyase
MRHVFSSLACCVALLVSAVAAAAEAPPRACCASLEEVRTNIDRIDAEILELMAERGTYVAQAAKFKPSAAAVHDGARVERIIVRIRGLAAEHGLSPDVAEATWRAMIAAFTDYEKTLVKP